MGHFRISQSDCRFPDVVLWRRGLLTIGCKSSKVKHVSRISLAAALLLTINVPWVCDAKPNVLQRGIARISIVKLHRAVKLGNKNFIVVPLQDCAILINGQRTTLKRGDFREVNAGEDLSLSPLSAASPRLALIQVVASSQALTITSESLAAHEVMEDASDRNQTLVIALDRLEIRDETDLAGEGEPSKPGGMRVLRLQRGGTGWLNQGMHRVRNARSTVARFVTIEW